MEEEFVNLTDAQVRVDAHALEIVHFAHGVVVAHALLVLAHMRVGVLVQGSSVGLLRVAEFLRQKLHVVDLVECAVAVALEVTAALSMRKVVLLVLLGSVEQGADVAVAVEVDVQGVIGEPSHLELVVGAVLVWIEVAALRLHVVVLPHGDSAQTELGQEGGLANCDQRFARCLIIRSLCNLTGICRMLLVFRRIVRLLVGRLLPRHQLVACRVVKVVHVCCRQIY